MECSFRPFFSTQLVLNLIACSIAFGTTSAWLGSHSLLSQFPLESKKYVFCSSQCLGSGSVVVVCPSVYGSIIVCPWLHIVIIGCRRMHGWSSAVLKRPSASSSMSWKNSGTLGKKTPRKPQREHTRLILPTSISWLGSSSCRYSLTTQYWRLALLAYWSLVLVQIQTLIGECFPVTVHWSDT